jgi:hypothetical protein
MIALVDAKRDEFLEELDAIDGRDLMDSEVTKWNRISEKITALGFSTHFRDGMICKGKWHLILYDYRKVVDYHARTGINDEDYWLLIPNELTIEKLSRAFSKEIYVRLHDWFGRRPQIQPLHLRDLLNPHDEVFQRGDFDNVDDNVEIVDFNVNETNVEGVDCTPNINHVHPTIVTRWILL